MDTLIPSQAAHRAADILSPDASDETKAQTARWFAEMMTKDFLSRELPKDVDCHNMSLGELIDALLGRVDGSVIDSLRFIKELGDKASHYHPQRRITKEEAVKAVKASLGLYQMILVDHLKKHPLNLHPDRATLLSTLLPSIRLEVLTCLIVKVDFDSEHNKVLLHKWCLACVKSGKRDKGRRKLRQLVNQNRIDKEFAAYEERSMNEIAERMKNDELPVPKNHSDFARNFADVKRGLNKESVDFNRTLIELLEGMAKDVEPSDMAHYKGMQMFLV